MTAAKPSPLAFESNLPDGWVSAKLGALVSPSKEKIEPGQCPDAPYLSLEHVESHTGRILGHGHAREVKSTKTVFRAGDVIYGKLRPYLNKASIPNFAGVCSTDFLVFPHSISLGSRILLWFLLRPEVVEFANHHSTGVQLPRVNFDALAELEFPLPPLAEQKRIVKKVELLLARVNAARDRLTRLPAILKRFRQSLLSAACSGRLTADWRDSGLDKVGMAAREQDEIGFPEGWKQVELGSIAELVSGVGFPEQHQNKQGLAYPFFKVGNLGEVPSGTPLIESKHTVDDQLVHQLRARVLPSGSIVFAKIGMAIALNRRRLLARPACIDNNMMAAIPADAALPAYLLRFLETVDFMPLTQATTVPSIRKSSLAELQVPLPPKDEQEEVVRRVEALFKLADAIEKRVAAATVRAEKLTQAILAKAFRGELVPTEAELARREGRSYEPASALLARIRAARQALPEKPGQRSPKRRTPVARRS